VAIRTIITPENLILRRKARRVTVFDGRLQQFIDDMAETMRAAPGVGLAAPQVAVSQRVIVVRLPDETEEDRETYGDGAGVLYAVVNPEIARASCEMADGVEGCLSIPGYLGTVNRHQAVTVKGQDRHGKKMRIKADGWLARVFQHEIDHLGGVLFIDIASEVWPIQESGTVEGPEALEAASETRPIVA
jgi:peptide deformylase